MFFSWGAFVFTIFTFHYNEKIYTLLDQLQKGRTIFRWRKIAVLFYFFWSLVRVAWTRSISEPDLNAPITFKYFVHLITQGHIPACIAAKQKIFPRKKGLFYYRAQYTAEYVLARVLLCTLHRKHDIRIPVHKREETRREKWPCRGSFWRLYSGLGRLPSCTYRLSLWK